MSRRSVSTSGPIVTLLCAWFATAAAAEAPFAIQVVDAATGRGVPLVELRTVDNAVWVTDSAGLTAIDDPTLLGREVYFYVRSHGYKFPADGFGFHGKALQVVAGGSARLELKRLNVAERLYRVTGAGIYRDSVLLGPASPIKQPLENAQVAGSDSVNSILFAGRVYWFWGDTNRLRYPLGCFHVPGAVSRLPAEGGLPIAEGVDLEYFTRDDGFVADTCRMPGDGPTWIDGLCTLRDSSGRERMFAKYVKVRKQLDVYERGLVEWEDAARQFRKVVTFDFSAPIYPLGHALPHTVDGLAYLYFGNPYPVVRVLATPEALADPAQYEAFTPLAAHSRANNPAFDLALPTESPRWDWKRDALPPTPAIERQWLRTGKLPADHAVLTLRDADSGKALTAHGGSVNYNPFRGRFVMIAEESGGTSFLGEVWYAEADTPAGPWVYARKIVTHDKYSFYNPRQHPMFDADGGRRIYFEGTYSTFFSGNDAPTPRYDYNQIMYSLDLADERVVLPVPFYERTLATLDVKNTDKPRGDVLFMALDRLRSDAVAVLHDGDAKEHDRLRIADTGTPSGKQSRGEVAFYALPVSTEEAPATTIALYEWTNPETGEHAYRIDKEAGPGGFKRSDRPLCRVWRYPISPRVHFDD